MYLIVIEILNKSYCTIYLYDHTSIIICNTHFNSRTTLKPTKWKQIFFETICNKSSKCLFIFTHILVLKNKRYLDVILNVKFSKDNYCV